MDRNIAFMEFASKIFKIVSVLVFVGGGLVIAFIQLPAIAALTLMGSAAGVGAVSAGIGVVNLVVQGFSVLIISFGFYTIARVLDFLADMGDEIYDLRRIRFEQSNPRR